MPAGQVRIADCQDGDIVVVEVLGEELELVLMQRYRFGGWGALPAETAAQGRLAGGYVHLDDDQVVLSRRSREAVKLAPAGELDPLLRGACVEPLLGGAR